MNKKYSKSPKTNYPTNKTDVYFIDDNWSLDILDLKNYGPQNKRTYGYVSVIKGSFSKFGWKFLLENKMLKQ